MKKTDKIAYRQKSVAELDTAIYDLKKKLVESRAKLQTGAEKNTSIIKKLKYEIALLKTLIIEKNIQSK